MHFYNFPILALDEPFYVRCEGYLTNNIYNVLSNFNALTDLIVTIRYLSTLKGYDLYSEDETIAKIIQTISAFLNEALNGIRLTGTAEENDKYCFQAFRHPCLTHEDRYMWCLYFTIELFRTLPQEYLFILRG
jgi:hypothetical protein